ncbi:MAG: hypothetical protein ABIN61_03900 [candidate division WOR-3 bacterium]
MFLSLISMAYLWIYEGDSLYKGIPKGTVISRDSIYLGKEIDTLPWESSGFISSIVKIDKDLYLGISDLGMVVRISETGKKDTILNREGAMISLSGKGNTLIVGLSPLGKTFFIKGSKIIDSLSIPAENVFSISDFKGKLLFGTGPFGKVFKLENRNFKEVFKVEATSVTKIFKKGDELFLGTANPGVIYKLEKDSILKVYYDPQLEEINGLGFIGETLCVSGLSQTEKENIGEIKFFINNMEYEVYKGTPILCGEESGGTFYAGEGEDGQIGEFHKDDLKIILDLEESRITTLKSIDGELWIGTGYPAKVYKIKNKMVKEGEYISSVFKGGYPVVWGNLNYEGKGDISFFIRGGNKKEVDSSWSKWEKIENSISIKTPFIQWKAVLKRKSSSLKKVQISYGKQNSPPQIEKLTALPPRVGSGRGTENFPFGGSNISQEEKERLRKMGFFIPEEAFFIPEGLLCFYWEARDPEQDRLLFDLYISSDSKTWEKIKEDLTNNSYFINISAYPDGNYYVKLVAKDNIDQTQPLKAEKITSFLVDQTPPEIKEIEKKYIGDSVVVSGIISDELSPIIGAKYTTKITQEYHWKNAKALDGLFDEMKEKFQFKVHKKEENIAIRGLDKSGNVKVIRIKI